jgi:hypothetical protein
MFVEKDRSPAFIAISNLYRGIFGILERIRGWRSATSDPTM